MLYQSINSILYLKVYIIVLSHDILIRTLINNYFNYNSF